MIQSMTGFAERSFDSRALRVKVSIKSLNHRFFDWSYKGTQIGDIENKLRARCQDRLHRGRIEVTMDLVFTDASSWDVDINEGLLGKILVSFDRISARLKKDVHLGPDALFRIPQLLDLRRKDLTAREAAFLESCFLKTLKDVIRSRREEGKRIAVQIRRHLMSVKRAVNRVEKLAGRQPKAVERRIRQKLKDANAGGPLSEERLSEEVAYLTQRYDVSEEIQRLKSHIEAGLRLVGLPSSQPAGKMLDFLAQELSREANTLNSKSQNISLTREGLFIKGEVECIRQQVQNLE
jgi:uncharacterized protein (TIGR00255 family)